MALPRRDWQCDSASNVRKGRRRDVGPRQDLGEARSRRIERRGAGLARRDDMAANADFERQLAAGRCGRLIGAGGLCAGDDRRDVEAGQE